MNNSFHRIMPGDGDFLQPPLDLGTALAALGIVEHAARDFKMP
ncbi:hypothetical protein [Pseudomonas sp. YJ42]